VGKQGSDSGVVGANEIESDNDSDSDSATPHLTERATGKSTVLHSGFLHLVRDEVQLPDGQLATREYIQHAGAVAVLAVKDDGRVVLVRQHRYPLGRVLLELPAGRLEPGETTLACAQRELLEETGYLASEWAFGLEIHNAAAYSSESIWIWLARGLKPGPQQLDVGEFVEVVEHTEAELDALCASGGLPDVKTIVGLHLLQRWRGGARSLQWHSCTP
jgi:ADP-ribose pyrophosphatase